MDFKKFQEEAKKTDIHPSNDPDGLAIPILGLLGEAGNLATVYKKYLRDGIPWDSNKKFIQQELGDILWYVSTIATHCGFNLNEIAELNLNRIEKRYGHEENRWNDDQVKIPLDIDFPETERFPRKLKFLFEECSQENGNNTVTMTLVYAEPNLFPNGSLESESGRRKGFTLGSPLTDKGAALLR